MSTAGPEPIPPPGTEPASSGGRSAAAAPDARGFFVQMYKDAPEVPKGATAPNIDAFEAKFGKGSGYTRDQLTTIAKKARAEVRKARGEPADQSDESALTDPKAWEWWISRIRFGIYLLAAIGVIFFAIVMAKGPAFSELRPYLGGIVSLAIVLALLSIGVVGFKHIPDGPIKSVVIVILIVFLSLLALMGLVVVGIFMAQSTGYLRSSDSAPIRPPAEFTFAEAGTYSDNIRLPDDVFGNAADDIGRPRAWMRDLELGSHSQLNVPTGKHFWLFANEASNTDYRAFIGVGTADGLVVRAFLAELKDDPNSSPPLIPLRQLYSANPAEYLFRVPKSTRSGRLLVFVAMTDATFTKWHEQRQKFVIKS
jgi:hypothetical protein